MDHIFYEMDHFLDGVWGKKTEDSPQGVYTSSKLKGKCHLHFRKAASRGRLGKNFAQCNILSFMAAWWLGLKQKGSFATSLSGLIISGKRYKIRQVMSGLRQPPHCC